ncbi:protein FAM234A [Cavia porcellus]|uniref:Protein FAM234A n=1 Tax=Cavia porcellus TaxID=10141 RepID=H0VJ74_CAVPO|nr:protein FAM234A [Cavia porcellus]XP_005007391.1 protein FAM234A [Cavia porcellus]XP_005007392.1 protein FAM234A [Cavia porcellus]XP_023416558.1 protein FAM234A [Cavia porcellus]
MMENKDLEAEIHPLKNEDRKSQENLGNRLKNEDNLKSAAAQSRLSRCRTVAFFLSLFICLLVVFVVSFIIPCPDRPMSQSMWRIDYNAAVTYDFLVMEDINKDKIRDVVFLYKNTNGSNSSNRSCTDEGFSSPCVFMAAVSGANGSVLWERPMVQDVVLVECTMLQPSDSKTSSACILVGRPGSFLAIDLLTGETLWNHPSSFGANTSILSPLLQVPDIDSDGAPDLLILTQEGKEVSGSIYSGSTGHQIGNRGSLGMDGNSSPLLHITRTGAHYILLPCASSLCGCSLKDLYEKVTRKDAPFKSDPHWENMLNASTHRLLPSSGAVRYLMNVPGKAGQDVLLVSSEACVLLDGQDLTPRWTLEAAQVLRKPILGHYKPDTPAVVIENGTGIDRQILLLDLRSGAILWSQILPSFPGVLPSTSLPTADHRSAFFFWGLRELTDTNEMDPRDARHSLYIFHPTLPSVLLEVANVSANTVAFNVILLESSRHAAYVLLTGPASSDVPGLVSVIKHKVRDLVSDSRVIHLDEGRPDSDQAIRDRFSWLRYRSEV